MTDPGYADRVTWNGDDDQDDRPTWPDLDVEAETLRQPSREVRP